MTRFPWILFLISMTGCHSPSNQTTLLSDTESQLNPAFQAKLDAPEEYDPREWLDKSKTICRDNNLVDVIDYKGDRGVEIEWVRQQAVPVGALQHKRNGKKFCSGTLISENLFLTANHCIGADIEEDYVVFNYQNDKNGKIPKEVAYRVLREVENGGRLDYSVLEIADDPGSTLGYSNMRFSDADNKEKLVIIQHPKGMTKKIDAGPAESIRGNYLYYMVDTQGGSSGSGVLDTSGDILAVHTNGGCRSAGSGRNSGVRLSKIPEESILRSL